MGSPVADGARLKARFLIISNYCGSSRTEAGAAERQVLQAGAGRDRRYPIVPACSFSSVLVSYFVLLVMEGCMIG